MGITKSICYLLSRERKCYCDGCRKQRKYYVYDVSDIPGRAGDGFIRFPGKMARCMVCHSMVFPEEIKEFNETAYKHAVSAHI